MNLAPENDGAAPLKRVNDDRGVLRLVLSRPRIHNAFDDTLVRALLVNLEKAEKDVGTRVIVIQSEGKNFSAGADLNWMRRLGSSCFEKNFQDAKKLAKMLALLYGVSKPVVTAVQGHAIGGGIGLIAASDIAIASNRAVFAFSEVRLGLVPATISPYVIRSIGERAARRWFLTGERFGSKEALQMGLIHERVPERELSARVERIIDQLLMSGPSAISASKQLINYIKNDKYTANELINRTAKEIANIRSSDEAKEGIDSFLSKKVPSWVKK